MVTALLSLALLTGVGVVTVERVNAAPPPPQVHLQVPASFVPAPGPPPPVQLPPQGSLVLRDGDIVLASLHADVPRPIASVAKTMTALLVLRHHPIRDGDLGPVLTMTDADVQDWRDTLARDGSSLPVHAGEQLTERDMLFGLMLPSANNFADTLARWDAGSIDAFVAAMNDEARQLGMASTHFADPSGFSPQTVSTAADLVRLGSEVVKDPVLMGIVGLQHARLPEGLAVDNLDTLLGTEPGWLGIKTGETPQAGGCLLFAVSRALAPGTPSIELVGAVLGQTDLHAALDAARTAVNTAYRGYVVVSPSVVPPLHGSVTTRWGESAGLHVLPDPGDGLVVRRGTVLQLSVRQDPVELGVVGGPDAGFVRASLHGHYVFQWGIALDRALLPPSGLWMLFRN
jgi:D-alanyl-D-alanine carboxypeptidase (penicillin-binding protein 5/6)